MPKGQQGVARHRPTASQGITDLNPCKDAAAPSRLNCSYMPCNTAGTGMGFEDLLHAGGQAIALQLQVPTRT